MHMTWITHNHNSATRIYDISHHYADEFLPPKSLHTHLCMYVCCCCSRCTAIFNAGPGRALCAAAGAPAQRSEAGRQAQRFVCVRGVRDMSAMASA